MELKKSYKGFIYWLIGFVVATFGCAFFPMSDGSLATRVVLNVTALAVAILAFIIYKTEFVYWYNGVSYEAAVKAGSQRRKTYGWEHFKRFGIFAGGYLIFSVVAHGCGWSLWWDILIATVGLVAVAVSTIWIKL